jgi:hypothetical protein
MRGLLFFSSLLFPTVVEAQPNEAACLAMCMPRACAAGARVNTLLEQPRFALGVSLRSAEARAAVPIETTIIAEAEVSLNAVWQEMPPLYLEVRPIEAAARFNFSWLAGWWLERDGALFRPVGTSKRVAFAYSDVFETRRNPEKGGHGVSILYRCDL